MDNLTYRIADVEINATVLTKKLKELGIPVSRKTIPKQQDETITFSLPIGKYGCRWMFRYSLKRQSITCSGGVTKTFFAHNVWVLRKESAQLEAIIKIVSDDLAKIDGITLPTSMDAMSIERVELTRHHLLSKSISKRRAIDRLSAMFMAVFPDRHFRNGANLNEAGTTGIGLNKSSRVCRVYDPYFKFKDKPAHVPEFIWNVLKEECEDHLRVELMFAKRELLSAKLSQVPAWQEDSLIEALIAKRYADYGLSMEFKTAALSEAQVASTNLAFVEAARYFFTDGERGARIDIRNGSSNRFKRYMADKGYCTDVPFPHHVHLAHGLHELLQPELAVELSQLLRSNRDLFDFWW